MSIFHWSPIKKNLKDVEKRTEFSKVPDTFVPRNYVRQRKRKLYNNLLVLLGGLWALTVSHNMDTSDTETRIKLRNILGASGLFVSHLVAVPLIIWKLNLHYSIILGAMGMSVTPFFYYVRNLTVLSVVICLRMIFVALFDVSAMMYIVRLARICSKIAGNALFNEILASRGFTAIFGCTANVVSSAWHQYVEESETKESIVEACGSNYCPRKLSRRSRLASTLSAGQSTIFVAVTIIVALSGIILIAMYLKPLSSLGDSDFSDEPRTSSPYHVLKQITKPKAKELAILVTSCTFMNGFTEDFVRTYVNCSFPDKYSFLITSLKEFTIMFAAISCLTIVDFTGFYWLYGLACFFQTLTFFSLLLWNSSLLESQFSYLIVYYVLCTSLSVETSVLQLLVIQTLGDEEVSSWCFYYALTDVAYVIRLIPENFICIGVELWIATAVSSIAIVTTVAYSHGFEDKKKVDLNEPCSLVIKTSKRTLAKSPAYNLNIIVEKPEDIQKIGTFMERKYTLATRFLVPPTDDVVFPEILPSHDDVDEDFG